MSKRHMYLRDYSSQNKHPFGCLAMEVDRERKEIRYALSVCSPQDKFNAKIARDKAFGRLIQQPKIIQTFEFGSAHDITRLVMADIANSQKESSKSRSHLAFTAALEWLAMSAMKYGN